MAPVFAATADGIGTPAWVMKNRTADSVRNGAGFTRTDGDLMVPVTRKLTVRFDRYDTAWFSVPNGIGPSAGNATPNNCKNGRVDAELRGVRNHVEV